MGKLTYKRAGVDVDAGDAFAEAVGAMVSGTRPAEVVSGIGGFAAAYAPDLSGMTQPLLVSGTDGVGTKLKLAFQTGLHDTVGIDLVAMCVNDVLTTGAKPLFFLDYLATGRLDKDVALRVVGGVVEGCRQAGCALVGGETAEMPGFYAEGEYDLAGFAVGLVDEPRMLTGAACRSGDVVIGLPSSGVHSNGFSLVRRIVAERGLSLDRVYEGFDRPLGEVLLTPTVIYVKPVLDLLGHVEVRAMAHITGGGVPGNLPRVLPADLHAVLSRAAVPANPVFPFLQGDDVDDAEMAVTFNLGVGFMIVVPPDAADAATASLATAGLAPFLAGRLAPGPGEVQWE